MQNTDFTRVNTQGKSTEVTDTMFHELYGDHRQVSNSVMWFKSKKGDKYISGKHTNDITRGFHADTVATNLPAAREQMINKAKNKAFSFTDRLHSNFDQYKEKNTHFLID